MAVVGSNMVNRSTLDDITAHYYTTSTITYIPTRYMANPLFIRLLKISSDVNSAYRTVWLDTVI